MTSKPFLNYFFYSNFSFILIGFPKKTKFKKKKKKPNEKVIFLSIFSKTLASQSICVRII